MSDATSTVEFRDIQGFPGYRIGSDGSLWSSWRRHFMDNGKRGGTYSVVGDSWKLLKPRVENRPKRTPHSTACLKGHGRYRQCFVHTLVLESFVGPCPAGLECRHKDGNPQNNHLDNLSWGTRKQNVADQFLHGDFAIGIRHGNAKLTDDEVRQIRDAQGTHKTIASRFKIDRRHVGAIKNRVARKYVI